MADRKTKVFQTNSEFTVLHQAYLNFASRHIGLIVSK